MSAFVLDQNKIELLAAATDGVLRLNKKYPGSYPLNESTVATLGKYAGDLHSIYRALYITNIKAVNGRYRENAKTFPKYRPLMPWPEYEERLFLPTMEKACGVFDMYLYQICEEPVYGTDTYNAFTDVYKLLCMLLVKKKYNWDGEEN